MSMATRMTPLQAITICRDACPDMGGWWWVTMSAIGMAESALDYHAINLNDHTPTAESYLSVDWGWLQINDYWNGMTIEECRLMFDPRECVKKARDIFRSRMPWGEGYKAWNTYATGKHKLFLTEMIRVARENGIPGV